MKPKLGIIAGGGDLPRRIAEACERESRAYHILAIEGQADADALSGLPVTWCRLGAAAKALDIMHEQAVGEIVMAGPVKRPSLTAIRPDLTAVKVIARAGRKAFGDDGLLRSVIDEIEAYGVKVIGLDTVLPDLRPRPGVLGAIKPDEDADTDIQRGVAVLDALSGQDVGQAVVVQQGMVLGIEAAEGTDGLIERVAGLMGEGKGGVLIKLFKRGQEARVDLPTIGADTVAAAAKSGIRGIVVQANASLLIDQAETVARADRENIFLLALDRDGN